MRGMELARLGITGGLDKFGGLIKDQQQINQGVLDRSKFASQQDYLNALEGAATPEALLALRNSGMLDQRFNALGAEQQAAVRGAFDARLKGVQTQATAANIFANEQATNAEAPIKAKHAALVANNDKDGAAAFRAANPQVRDWSAGIQASYDTDRLRGSNARADALAILTNTNQIGDATQLTKTQGQRDAINSAALNLTATQNTANQTIASNTVADQRFTAATETAAAAYHQKILAGRGQLSRVANNLDLVLGARGELLNKDGTPAKMAGSVFDKFAEAAGAPSLGSMFSGDTAQADRFIREALKNHSAETINRNRKQLNDSFNSVPVGAPIGTEALAAATRQAQADVAQKATDAKNRFAPGTQNAQNAYETLAASIDKMMGPDEREDLPHIQSLLNKLSTTGIEIEGKFITPSAQDVLAAFRSTYEGWNFRNKGRAEDIEKVLKKNLAGSNVTQLLKDSASSEKANQARMVRDLLNGLTPAQPQLNPEASLPPVLKKK